MFKKLVVALNESACAMQARDLAMTLAKLEGAEIYFCSVVDPMSAMWRASSGPSAELALAQAKEAAARVIDESVDRARNARLVADGDVLAGDPASEIVKYASVRDADAIVMGTHGWTGIKHFVMGSVAEAVLRLAPCPVIVVRDQASVARHAKEAAS